MRKRSRSCTGAWTCGNITDETCLAAGGPVPECIGATALLALSRLDTGTRAGTGQRAAGPSGAGGAGVAAHYPGHDALVSPDGLAPLVGDSTPARLVELCLCRSACCLLPVVHSGCPMES